MEPISSEVKSGVFFPLDTIVKSNENPVFMFAFPLTDGGAGASGDATKKSRNDIVKEKTPTGKLEEQEEARHPYQEKEPLARHPGGVNPETGERNGPAGPEPTRYGDWERKGRVTDF